MSDRWAWQTHFTHSKQVKRSALHFHFYKWNEGGHSLLFCWSSTSFISVLLHHLLLSVHVTWWEWAHWMPVWQHTVEYWDGFKERSGSSCWVEKWSEHDQDIRIWSGHDQNTIRTWSGYDQDTIGIWSRHDRDMISTRSGHNENTIGTWSEHGQDTIGTPSGHNQNTIGTRSEHGQYTIG